MSLFTPSEKCLQIASHLSSMIRQTHWLRIPMSLKQHPSLPLMEILLASTSDSENIFRSNPIRISRTNILSFRFDTSLHKVSSNSSMETEQYWKERYKIVILLFRFFVFHHNNLILSSSKLNPAASSFEQQQDIYFQTTTCNSLLWNVTMESANSKNHIYLW